MGVSFFIVCHRLEIQVKCPLQEVIPVIEEPTVTALCLKFNFVCVLCVVFFSAVQELFVTVHWVSWIWSAGLMCSWCPKFPNCQGTKQVEKPPICPDCHCDSCMCFYCNVTICIFQYIEMLTLAVVLQEETKVYSREKQASVDSILHYYLFRSYEVHSPWINAIIDYINHQVPQRILINKNMFVIRLENAIKMVHQWGWLNRN